MWLGRDFCGNSADFDTLTFKKKLRQNYGNIPPGRMNSLDVLTGTMIQT